MTAPSSPGGRSPLWIAGVALIGVGVLSGVVGLIGLGTGGEGEPSASAAPPPSSAPAEPGTGGVPGDGTQPGATGAPGAGGNSPLTPGAPGTPGAVGGPAAPGAGAPGGQPVTDGGTAGSGSGSAGSGGSGGSGVAARPTLRVYNNSTIKGLAEKAAEEFRANGWTVSAVQNYPQGIIPATTVYYRNNAEKSAADEMARRWNIRSEPRFAGIQDASPGIIVIITKDFKAA